ncbi:outer membrane beta-barrel protein [Jannaschia sp. Os4]|uniref:outer membrane protein n=1 Tax=Jannaschia sp. Os4 TaxID=2807617 RepID=UPI00193A0E55|nr:outer membrane beta-barrel protein [Jannaschia sp. Os4]MBM2575904.1 outer membrane beta-barrel protein [Jannaschia sp. Os4]
MRKLLASAAFVAAATPVLGGNIEPVATIIVPGAPMTWTGFYAGAQLGYAKLDTRGVRQIGGVDLTEALVADCEDGDIDGSDNNGPVDSDAGSIDSDVDCDDVNRAADGAGVGATSRSREGLTYGVHAGFLKQLTNSPLVLGTELEYDRLDLDGAAGAADVVRLKAKVGYGTERFLGYGVVGPAYIDYAGEDETGFVYGLGAGYRATDNIVIGAEVLQHEFDDAFGSRDFDLDATTVNLRVSYQF